MQWFSVSMSRALIIQSLWQLNDTFFLDLARANNKCDCVDDC